MAKEKPALERGQWGSQVDFMLSCIGFAVGLGNVWRFPYLCYRNGGGAFLVPYLIMLAIAGLPLFYFELALGQFGSEGPITIWKINPMFMGVGWAMVLISALVSLYYNVIIMYSILYMFVSLVNLDGQLPWQDCSNKWNTNLCRTEPRPNLETLANESMRLNATLSVKNETCVGDLLGKYDWGDFMNPTVNATTIHSNMTECNLKYVTPSEEYWKYEILGIQNSPSIGELGPVSVRNCLFLLLAWTIIFFCLMKGVKSSGKVVYFTATFPYLILIVLLVRGVTLEGHMEGIKFYIVPKWEELKNPKVWGDAATQIFYSLGVAFGGLMTMASYNRFKNNCFRDAIIVAVINCSTSVFAGFAIFSLLGHMAYVTNVDVKDVADSGPGLAFIAYPEGIARLPGAPIWAFLFFFMIFTLGLDSQFAMMETVISGFSDLYPHQLRTRKVLFTFVACMIGFILGIPQVTAGGIRILTLIDWYSASYGIMIVALFEVVGVIYVYGIGNYRKDVEMMIGDKPFAFWAYWFFCWILLSPLAVLFIVIMMAVFYTPAGYDGVIFPGWAEGIGWIMVVSPVAIIIIVAIVQIIRYGGIKQACTPMPTWGPALNENRIGRYQPHPDLELEFEDVGKINRGFNSDAENGYNGKNGSPPSENYQYDSARM